MCPNLLSVIVSTFSFIYLISCVYHQWKRDIQPLKINWPGKTLRRVRRHLLRFYFLVHVNNKFCENVSEFVFKSHLLVQNWLQLARSSLALESWFALKLNVSQQLNLCYWKHLQHLQLPPLYLQLLTWKLRYVFL